MPVDTKWQSLAIGTYILLMMVIKLSIGIFLLRLAAQKIYTWILRVSIVVVTIWSLAIFFWNIFQCGPVDKQWDYRLTYGSCVSPGEIVSAAYAMTALTVLSDWLYVSSILSLSTPCVNLSRGDVLLILNAS